MVDSRRYLLGDMAGHLYVVHLLPQDEKTIRPVPSTSRDLTQSNARIGSICIELLGETTIPESIVYLDNGVVFVGSYLGDSQLLHLNSEVDPEKNSYITILEEFTNIGPIVDMVFMENDGQSQLITCSGCYKEGSLRIIRNGIGIQEHATIEQENIKGVWCLPIESETYDDSIIVSLVGRTQLLRLVKDDLTSLKLEGFSVTEQTLHCDVVYPNGCKRDPRPLLLQATTYGLRLIGIQSLLGMGCLSKWRSPTNRSVSSLASRGDLVVVASGSDLFALRITGTPESPEFTQIGSNLLPHEVACVDLTPFDRAVAAKVSNYSTLFQSPMSILKSPNKNTGSEQEPVYTSSWDPLDSMEPEYVAVGMWMGHGVALLHLPSLEIICQESLPLMTPTTGIAILPRSITIAQFEGLVYLLTVTGDGSLYYYNLDCSADKIVIRDPKRLSAGTGPHMRLTQWRSHDKRNVFVCSNRPCIVYSSRHKLVFSNVNIKEVSWMHPLNGSHYRDSICMVTPSGLVIGSVDNLQKLHVRRIPLNETPRRLALQQETNSLGVISCRREIFQEGIGFKPVRSSSASLSAKVPRSFSSTPKSFASSSSAQKYTDIEASSLLIFSQSNMDLQFVHTFHYSQYVVETAMSIGSVDIGDDASSLFAVGTALIVKGEHDPKKGRIHIFRWDPVSLTMDVLLTYDIHGAVFRIVEFNGRLLTAIGSSVRLFELCGNNLRLESAYNNNIMALYLRTDGNYVLVGDLMRSLTLLLYKPNRSTFEVIGRHHCPRYTSGIEIIDDEHFLSGDADGNIHVLGRNVPDNTEEPVVLSLRTSQPTVATAAASTSTSTPTSDVAGPADVASSIGSTNPSAMDATTTADAHEQPGPTAPLGDLPRCLSTDSKTLVDCAYIHTGESINVFVRGNMNSLGGDRWAAIGEIHNMYGSSQGCLGLVPHLSPILFAFLKEVESRLVNLIVPVGGFSQQSWRSCKDCLWTVRVAHNIIDGELIESFLDLNLEDKKKVVKGLKIPASMNDFERAGLSTFDANVETKDCTVNDLMRVVEELASLH